MSHRGRAMGWAAGPVVLLLSLVTWLSQLGDVGGFVPSVPTARGSRWVGMMGIKRKGNLENELANVGLPKDPKKKKKKKSSSRQVEDQPDAQTPEGAEGSMEPVEATPFDPERGLDMPEDVSNGKQVLDPTTRQAYYLPVDEDKRMAACFPRPSEESKAMWRIDWGPSTSSTKVLDTFKKAHEEGYNSMTDFVIANHDFLGYRAAQLLTGLKMNAMYRSDPKNPATSGGSAEVEMYEDIRRSFVLVDQTISVPLRQLTREAEFRLGPIASSGDAKDFKALTNLGAADVNALWLLIKAAVATWSDKVNFADDKISALTEAPGREQGGLASQTTDRDGALQSLKLWRNLDEAFMEDLGFVSKLRPELKFLDKAMELDSETQVRKYAAQTFCPEAGIALDSLRMDLRYLRNTVQRLAPQNYGALADRMNSVTEVLCTGCPDDVDVVVLARKQLPGNMFFESYELQTLESDPNQLSPEQMNRKQVLGNSSLAGFERKARQREQSQKEDIFAQMDPFKTQLGDERRADLSWYDAPNVKEVVEEIAALQARDEDMASNDPSKFPEVITMQRQLEALSREALSEMEAGDFAAQLELIGVKSKKIKSDFESWEDVWLEQQVAQEFMPSALDDLLVIDEALEGNPEGAAMLEEVWRDYDPSAVEKAVAKAKGEKGSGGE